MGLPASVAWSNPNIEKFPLGVIILTHGWLASTAGDAAGDMDKLGSLAADMFITT